MTLSPEEQELKNYELFYAIPHESVEQIRNRIDAGADVNFVLPKDRNEANEAFWTPLKNLVHGMIGDERYKPDTTKESAQELHRIGINVLQHAVLVKRPDIVELLLDRKADPFAKANNFSMSDLEKPSHDENSGSDAFEFAVKRNGVEQHGTGTLDADAADCTDKLIRYMIARKPGYPFLYAAGVNSDDHTMRHLLSLHQKRTIQLHAKDFDDTLRLAGSWAGLHPSIMKILLKHPAVAQFYQSSWPMGASAIQDAASATERTKISLGQCVQQARKSNSPPALLSWYETQQSDANEAAEMLARWRRQFRDQGMSGQAGLGGGDKRGR